MKCIKQHINLVFLFAYMVMVHAQNDSYVSDSLEVEKLVTGFETYYHNIDLYKKNFPQALDLIENNLLPNKKSKYFQIKRAAIKDRQSVILKIDEKYDEALAQLLKNISYKEEIGDFKTLAYTYRLIASIFVWQENYVKAKQYYTTGLELAKKYSNQKEANLFKARSIFCSAWA